MYNYIKQQLQLEPPCYNSPDKNFHCWHLPQVNTWVSGGGSVWLEGERNHKMGQKRALTGRSWTVDYLP